VKQEPVQTFDPGSPVAIALAVWHFIGAPVQAALISGRVTIVQWLISGRI